MAASSRSAGLAPVKKTAMRPPPMRPSNARSQSAAPSIRHERSGAVSPADSVHSVATNTTSGTKRKERDFDDDGALETNISVVVRCRGRNEREVRENSGVVLQTDGVRGRSVELSMGPSALSNKTYHFDKVFSPAADQGMIYEEVVTPLLDEMLSGFNCTIFAYGQTGTGKTYTMSGDMSNNALGMLSDAAGIIPRTLHALFKKLEVDESESSVKCSFIELYNEELRDLISVDDNVKLKIYEDNKKGHISTLIQGMEETYIRSAVEGVTLLQRGSHKRQVAATKCNDLSSRSHTVFTVTAYIKQTRENGEDYISAGKLNLVDLAGSENIQRSGAENKRAAEAGLINKSLLTLGRVINSLVDRGSHIPYRESKLTRLLQDSLGGRTKTCIIATVSPAKSNLEETISTLDYAFRAKNIRNKPQINQMVNKRTLLKEFTAEIEKLKSELIATRQRNGVYLTSEIYEEIKVESESRRILSEEQAAIIETMEANLRNKVQDLFTLTSNLTSMKKDHETLRVVLDDTKDILQQTELVLAGTRKNLAEECILREAHEETETRLQQVGTELLATLSRTVTDVGGLQSKLDRKCALESQNEMLWAATQDKVAEVTSLVEGRVADFQSHQQELARSVAVRIQASIEIELSTLAATQALLQHNVISLGQSQEQVAQKTLRAKNEMDDVLEEIKTLREAVKTRVGHGLQGLSGAAERISAEVLEELGIFHTHLHGSYSSLGRDFKTMFEGLVKHINTQESEINNLRKQLSTASDSMLRANGTTSRRLEAVLLEEREQGEEDRRNLLSQITSLMANQGEAQEARLKTKITSVQEDMLVAKMAFETSRSQYDLGMDTWNRKEAALIEDVVRSRESLKTKLKDDWQVANKHNASLQTSTASIQEETVRIVDEQMKDMNCQMQALDDFVSRARLHNARCHEDHARAVHGLTEAVGLSYDGIDTHFVASSERIQRIGLDVSTTTVELQSTLQPLHERIQVPLAELRSSVSGTTIPEYLPTGETPQKTQYSYPAELPRTKDHEKLLAEARGTRPAPSPRRSPSRSPTKPQAEIYHDEASDDHLTSTVSEASVAASTEKAGPGGLKEINMNVNAGSMSLNIDLATVCGSDAQPPPFKRSMTTGSTRLPLKSSKKASMLGLVGRENSVSIFSQSTSRRRSPRNA